MGWPVRPASAQSDRHQLGLTEYGFGGSGSAHPEHAIPAIWLAGQTGMYPPVRPPLPGQSDRYSLAGQTGQGRWSDRHYVAGLTAPGQATVRGKVFMCVLGECEHK
uniref:Uncharacterized protein n=1 Tax=Oryza sativa subsp. japonica TaxID=39947 RepID=Q7XB65_ORYSJ|nr:hypothetical protein [Oryza sativa Japonica Group]